MRLHFAIRANSGAYVDLSERVAAGSIGTVSFALKSMNGQAVLSPPASIKVDNRDGFWLTEPEVATSPFFGAWANRWVRLTLEADGLQPVQIGYFRIKPEADLEITPDGFAEIQLESLSETLRRADASDVGYGRGWYASIPWTVAFDKLRKPEDLSTITLPEASRPYPGSNEYNRRASSIGRPGDFRDDGFYEVFGKAVDCCYNEDTGVFCYATLDSLFEFDPVTMKWTPVALSFSLPAGTDILRVWHRKQTPGSGYAAFYLLLVAPREEATQNNGSGYYQPLDQKSERCNYAYFFAHNRAVYLVALDDVCLAPVIYRGDNQNQSIPGLPYSNDFGEDADYSSTNRCEALTIPFSQYVFAPISRRRTTGDGTYYTDDGIYLESVTYIRYVETASVAGIRSTTSDADLSWTISPDTSFPVEQQFNDNELRGGRGYYGIRLTKVAPFGWNTLTTGGPRYSLGQGPMIDVSYSIDAFYDPLGFFVTYVKFSEPGILGTGQYTVAVAYVKGTTQTLYEDAGSRSTLAIGTVPTFVVCDIAGYSNLKGYVFFGWYDYHGVASGGSRYAKSGLAVYPITALYAAAAPDLSTTAPNLNAFVFSQSGSGTALIQFTYAAGTRYSGRWTPVSMGFTQDFSGNVTSYNLLVAVLDRSEIDPSKLEKRLGFPYRILKISLSHNVSTNSWISGSASYTKWRGTLPPMGWTRRNVGEFRNDVADSIYFFSPGENALYETKPGTPQIIRRAASVPLTDQFLGVGGLAVGNEDGDVTKHRVCGCSSPVFPLTGEERWPSGQYEGWYFGERHSGRIPLLDNSSLSKWEAIRRVAEVGDSVYYVNRSGVGVLRNRPSAGTDPVLTLTKKDYASAKRSTLPIENYVTRSLGDVVPAEATVRVILGPFSNWNLVPAVSGFGALPIDVELKCIRGGLALGGNPWNDPYVGATFWSFKKTGKRITTNLSAAVPPGSSGILVDEIEGINVGDRLMLSVLDEDLRIDSIIYSANLLLLDRQTLGEYKLGDLVWIERADDNKWSASIDLFEDAHGVAVGDAIALVTEDAAAGSSRLKVSTIDPFGVGNLFALADDDGTYLTERAWYRVTKVYRQYEGDEVLGGDPSDQWIEFVYVDPAGDYDPTGAPGLQAAATAGMGILVWITLPPGGRRAAVGNTGLAIAAVGDGSTSAEDEEKPVVEGDRIQIAYNGLEIKSNSLSKVTARDSESIAKYGKLVPRGLQANRFMDPFLAEIDVNWRVQLGAEKRIEVELSGIYRKDILGLDPWDVVTLIDERLLPDRANNSADFLVTGISFSATNLSTTLVLEEFVDPLDRARTRASTEFEKIAPYFAFHLKADSQLYPPLLADGDYFNSVPTEDGNTIFTLGGTGAMPKFETDERKGMPVIRFDGSSDYTYAWNNGYFTNSRRDSRTPGMSIFVVAKPSAVAQVLLASYIPVPGYYEFILRSDRAIFYDTAAGGGAQTATMSGFVAGAYAIFGATYSPGATIKPYYNGNLGTPSGVLTDLEQGAMYLSLGADGTGSTRLNGDLCEVIIVPFLTTDAEREAIEDYLYEKWIDVPAAPPGSGHDSGFDDGHG